MCHHRAPQGRFALTFVMEINTRYTLSWLGRGQGYEKNSTLRKRVQTHWKISIHPFFLERGWGEREGFYTIDKGDIV